MKIIFLGPPGSGKGTQAEFASKKLGVPAISTGSILREAIRNKTETGILAKDHIDAGRLVPDEVVLEIVRERIARPDCESGYILDGVPRNIAQAEALSRMGVEFDIVVSLEIGDDVIESRMTGRRTCSACGAVFHIVSNPSEKEGVCDKCGGELVLRVDDKPETVRDRLSVYHENTEPLIGYYGRIGNLRPVAVDGNIDEVAQKVFRALE